MQCVMIGYFNGLGHLKADSTRTRCSSKAVTASKGGLPSSRDCVWFLQPWCGNLLSHPIENEPFLNDDCPQQS